MSPPVSFYSIGAVNLEYNKLIVKIKYNSKYVIYLYISENVFLMAELWAEISLRSIKLAGIAHAN
jgi:hypothetical protein